MQYVKANWLDGATSTGATNPEQVQGATRYGVFRETTGSPSSVSVELQGSLDGSSWFTLMTLNELGTPYVEWLDTPRSVSYVRLNLTTLSGGTSPTVTASMIASDA